MGYNDGNRRQADAALVFDCEAVAIDGASDYLDPLPVIPQPDLDAIVPAGNLKDPAKIAESIAKRRLEAIADYQEQTAKAAAAFATRLGSCGLDVDLARIVAIGALGSADEGRPVVMLARDEQDEADVLRWFWARVGPLQSRPTLVGFNCLGYDLPLMLRRSLYLNVPAPRIPLGRYRHDGVEDLMLTLSFDGALKFRGLAFYCKRFTVNVPDETSGKDIAALVAAGNWAGVEAHCRADVLKTAWLAQRIGVLAESERTLAEVF